MPLEAMLSMLGFVIRPGDGFGGGAGDFLIAGLTLSGFRGLAVGVLVMDTEELTSFRGVTGALASVMLADMTGAAGAG